MTKCYVSRVLPPLPIEALDGWRTRARCNNHPTLAASTWDDSIAHEAAKILRVSPMTVYRLADSGELPVYRFGKRGSVRIDRNDLYKYLRQARSGW